MDSLLIETPRLQLRTLGEADIPELVPLIGAQEVAATTLRIPHPYQEKHAREFLAIVAKENELRLGIRLRSNGRLCGVSGCTLKRNTVTLNSGTGSASRTGAMDTLPRQQRR